MSNKITLIFISVCTMILIIFMGFAFQHNQNDLGEIKNDLHTTTNNTNTSPTNHPAFPSLPKQWDFHFDYVGVRAVYLNTDCPSFAIDLFIPPTTTTIQITKLLNEVVKLNQANWPKMKISVYNNDDKSPTAKPRKVLRMNLCSKQS